VKEWLKSVLSYEVIPKIKLGVRFFGPPCIVGLHHIGWWRGVVCNAFRMKRSYSTPGPVSIAMGDCLWAGKPSWCEACQLGRLSLLPSVGRGQDCKYTDWPSRLKGAGC